MQTLMLDTWATKFKKGRFYSIVDLEFKGRDNFEGTFIGYERDCEGEVKLAVFRTSTVSGTTSIDMDFLTDRYYSICERTNLPVS